MQGIENHLISFPCLVGPGFLGHLLSMRGPCSSVAPVHHEPGWWPERQDFRDWLYGEQDICLIKSLHLCICSFPPKDDWINLDCLDKARPSNRTKLPSTKRHSGPLMAEEAQNSIRQQVQMGSDRTVATWKLLTFNSFGKGWKLPQNWGLSKRLGQAPYLVCRLSISSCMSTLNPVNCGFPILCQWILLSSYKNDHIVYNDSFAFNILIICPLLFCCLIG